MNLRDLEYLVAVADHLHFGRAAEHCHVSQPTLSMQVKKLEEYLGVTLFERGGKQVLVTPIGEAVTAQARTVLRGAKDIRELALHAQNPLAGEFRLGAFPTLAPYLLPICVPPIHKQLPKLKLLLVEEKTDKLLDSLLAGALDAALLALPLTHGQEHLESLPLFEDTFLLAIPHNHPLAGKTSVTIEDILSEPLLLLEEGHCLRAQALEICTLAGMREYQEFRATSMETLRQMVASGIGVTLIPQTARKRGDGITYLPFADTRMSRTIGIVWRKGYARETVIREISGIIKARME